MSGIKDAFLIKEATVSQSVGVRMKRVIDRTLAEVDRAMAAGKQAEAASKIRSLSTYLDGELMRAANDVIGGSWK